jgi:GntR family transcriptional regulator
MMPIESATPARGLHLKTVNRSGKLPIYIQIFEILRDRILSGDWKTGDLLPPEPELMKMYQVSRITVRQAVEKLAIDNLVVKRQGKGTYVSYAALQADATKIIGFEKDMLQRGLKPSTRLISARIVIVSRLTAEKLGIQVGDELAFIQRLRLANDAPISLEEVLLVHSYCPGILDIHDFEHESVFDVLETDYGIRIERANQIISAMMAPKGVREFLDISSTQSLIYIERISYSQLDIPVEIRHIYYRADRYALQMSLKR